MALSQKTIVVTPRTGVGSPVSADPNIRFDAAVGSPDGVQRITLYARPINNGTLSFEGSAGQLFSITNDFTGTIFSVNDVSGIPSIEVDADGAIRLAEFGGTVNIGNAAGSPAYGVMYGSPSTLTVAADLKLAARNQPLSNFATFRMGANTLEIFGSPGSMLWIQTYGVDFITRKGGAFRAYETADINFIEVNHDGTDGRIAADGTSGLSFEADYHAFNGEIRAAASTTSQSSLNIPEGTAPSAPADGDIWVTTTDIIARINGVSESLLGGGAASSITITTSATASNFKVPFANTTASTTGDYGLLQDSTATFTYNPSTNTLTAGNFSGNASTASQWQTTRTITMSGDVSSDAVNIDGSGNVTITNTVVANDSHTHAFNNLTSKTSGTGNYQTSGDFIADNFEATGLGPNSDPGTDDLYMGGYGVLGSRTQPIYITNFNSGGVQIGAGAAHGASSKSALFTDTQVDISPVDAVAGTHALLVTNSGTANAIAKFVGDTDGLEINTVSAGDYTIRNTGQNNYITFYDGTGGTDIGYNGSLRIEMDSGNDVALYHAGVQEFNTLDSNAAGNTSGASVKDHSQTFRDVGFNDLRLTENNPASVTVDEANIGGVIYADDNTGFTVTLPSSTSSFPIGGVITIINANTSGNITVADAASYTCFYLDGSTRTDIVGSATIGPGGVATIWRQTTGGTAAERTWLMWGSGITP